MKKYKYLDWDNESWEIEYFIDNLYNNDYLSIIIIKKMGILVDFKSDKDCHIITYELYIKGSQEWKFHGYSRLDLAAI